MVYLLLEKMLHVLYNVVNKIITKMRVKVRKTDMMQIDGVKIEFNYMGLFTTEEEWIHPRVVESTCEIIYVTGGTVYLAEEGTEYAVEKGSLIILEKGKEHYGLKPSSGKTSFYWLHFNTDADIKTSVVKDFAYVSLFKELLHYSSTPVCKQYVKDCVLAHLLSEISVAKDRLTVSNLASTIFEWTRINAVNGLTVARVSEHFGYNSEHISRLIKKQYGVGLKTLINDFIIKRAKNFLCNTSCSVKEISNMLEFPSPNSFIHFYKYHEKESPTQYRNSYSNIHMNKQ